MSEKGARVSALNDLCFSKIPSHTKNHLTFACVSSLDTFDSPSQTSAVRHSALPLFRSDRTARLRQQAIRPQSGISVPSLIGILSKVSQE